MNGGHAVQECVSNKCSAALGKVDEEHLVTMVARSAHVSETKLLKRMKKKKIQLCVLNVKLITHNDNYDAP